MFLKSSVKNGPMDMLSIFESFALSKTKAIVYIWKR